MLVNAGGIQEHNATHSLLSSMFLLAQSPIRATMILQVFCYALPSVASEYQVL